MFRTLTTFFIWIWRRLSRLEVTVLLAGAVYGLARLAGGLGVVILQPSFLGFALFAFISLLVVSVLVRLLGLILSRRDQLLWSLRNRLFVSYLFIAVVPVLLLVFMALLSIYLAYQQLGAYLFRVDLEKRLERMAAVAETVPQGFSPALSEAGASGMKIEAGKGREYLRTEHGDGLRFVGLVQRQESVELVAVVARRADGAGVVMATVPFDAVLLDSLVPDLGKVNVNITQPILESAPTEQTGALRFNPIQLIETRNRVLAPPAHWLDPEILVAFSLEAVIRNGDEIRSETNPVFVGLSTRPSLLNRRLFRSLGQLSDVASGLLFITGGVFLMIQMATLWIGVMMTRTITKAVSDLYQATLHVQAGDFNHRVRSLQHDQLGALAESFNTMTSSVASLIEEQKQRQRLENELAIAQQVQAQLFPQCIPKISGVQLAAVCRAARVVSGDYYDFISLGEDRLGLAIADISGKGISAALLMASLQTSLRSQVFLDPQVTKDTKELVSRLNRLLFLNTTAERYATLFYATYDARDRTLAYTNAGHLPPLVIGNNGIKKLDEGGMVVGLFDGVPYQQGFVQVEPGSLMVAYSDGLVEPENVYGEQFGMDRIAEEVLRRRDESPRSLAESLVRAAEEWGGSAEQADDMTVIVMRVE